MQEIARRFSLSNQIPFEEIDNSIGESAGEVLDMRALIDGIRVGSPGQPETGSLGGNIRGLSIFMDGHPLCQQDLYFPQLGGLDLNSVLLTSISRVEFFPAGVADLLGKGQGILGMNIVTKDFEGGQPYSRVSAHRGPFGFHRTQVQLGRALTSRGKFYFTTEFRKSDGYLPNADCDGFSLWGKTSFSLSRRADLRLSTYQYKTKMGLPLFPDLNSSDARKKVNNWGVEGAILFQKSAHELLKLNLQYEKHSQQVKSNTYGFETKKIEEVFGLTANQTLCLAGRHHLKIEGYAESKVFKTLKTKHKVFSGLVSIADLIQIRPSISLLLSSKMGKEEGLDAAISSSGGISYQITKEIGLFSTLTRGVGYPTLMDRYWAPFSLSFIDTLPEYMEEGDGNLKLQKSITADFGLDILRQSFKMSGYLFNSRIDRFIFWSNVDTTIHYGHFKPINTKALIRGTGVDVEFVFLDHLRLHLSYSYKQSKDLKRKIILPYFPKHSLYTYIQFDDEFLKREIGLKLRLETTVLSKRFMDEYQQDEEPAVALLNGKVTIRFLDFYFYYIARNITDQKYRLMDDYPMPERSFWWGFSWEFFD